MKQEPAEAPRARTSNRIWNVISNIQLFACKTCEVVFGGCYKNEKIAIVARELRRIFNDHANIINCREQILHWQEQLKKLGCKINPEGIKEGFSGMSQENLFLLGKEFDKSIELGWFVDLVKEKSRNDFESDLLVNLQAYFSIPFENSENNAKRRDETLQAIGESVENFRLASYEELRGSVESVLSKVRNQAVLRHMENGTNNVQIAEALVSFLKQEVNAVKRDEHNAERGIVDEKQVQHFHSKQAAKLTQQGVRNQSPRKAGNKHCTNVSSSVKDVFSALSNLNSESGEAALERAAYSLMKLGSMILQGTSLEEVKSELNKQFEGLDDCKKKKVVACSSSSEMSPLALTGRKIRTSIGMKINQGAINLLNKSAGSAAKEYVLDDVQKNVDFVLDVIMSLKIERTNVPVDMRTGAGSLHPRIDATQTLVETLFVH